jgi:hypothetical protein
VTLFERERMISGVGGLRGDPQFSSTYPAGHQGTEVKETGRFLCVHQGTEVKETGSFLCVHQGTEVKETGSFLCLHQGTEVKETGRFLCVRDKPTNAHLLVYHVSIKQSLMNR